MPAELRFEYTICELKEKTVYMPKLLRFVNWYILMIRRRGDFINKKRHIPKDVPCKMCF